MEYRRELLSKCGKTISLLINEVEEIPRLTVIESHGGIGNSAEETAKANKLLINYCELSNINYIALDFSNNGTRKDQPENETIYSHRVQDLESAIDFVEKKYNSPVLLYGSSLGGHITLNTAEYSNSIKGIILNCPALKAFENVRDSMDQEQFNSWQTKGVADYGYVNVAKIPYAFYQDLQSHIAMEVIPRLKIPILIFQGTADKITPVEDAREAKKLNSQIELVEIEGGGHRFGDQMQSSEYNHKVQKFIERILHDL